MSRRGHRKGRPVDGILLLDKPLGLSSNDALQKVKRLFRAEKVGHTGSLDPLATGMLPLCFGGATRVSAYLLDSDKTYLVRVHLGVATTTGDAEGEVIDTQPVNLTEQDILAVLPKFTGTLMQLPPMYSALKHNGERLYKLAREGIEVEREPREIKIHRLELKSCVLPEFELEVRCSKGTYVRTLAEDIGKALGSCAHVSGLRRTAVGPYEAGMYTLDQLGELARAEGNEALDKLLLPVDTGLGHWPAIKLGADSSFYIRQGQAVQVAKAPTEGLVRLYGVNDEFIGVGEIDDQGLVAPRRILANS